jgi:predicted ester cyclase
MSNTDIVKAGIAAFSSGDSATLSTLLTDDFTLAGPVPQPIGKSAFLGLARALVTAFPDWSFNASGFREEGDKVYLLNHITGTHTGTLAAIPGVPPVPATGKHVAVAEEQAEYTVRGGQVSHIEITPRPGGGVPALYAQVGAPLG